jgi:ATP-dependent exoDNAse (exonuclease V) alpha subunit
LIKLGSGREYRIRDKIIHLQNKRMLCVNAEEVKSSMSTGRDFETFKANVYNGQIGVLIS